MISSHEAKLALQELGYEIASKAASRFRGEPFAPGYHKNKEEFRKVVTQETRIKRTIREWQQSVMNSFAHLVDWQSIQAKDPKANDYRWSVLEQELAQRLEKELTPAVKVGFQYGEDMLKIPFDIDVSDKQAIKAIRKRARFAAKSIVKTMRDRFINKLNQGLNQAAILPVDEELEETLLGTVEDRDKSDQIGQTEVIAAVTIGILLYGLFAQDEIEERSGERPDLVKQWETMRDPAVCPICTDLSGDRVPVGSTFDGYEAPPDPHPRCRCFLVIALK